VTAKPPLVSSALVGGEQPEEQVVQILYKYFESLFPKVCPNCNRCFSTLREYILGTTRIGTPVCYDAEIGNWKNHKIIGSVVSANCPCGSTLALTTQKMEMSLRLELLNWVMTETQQRGVNPPELLEYLRNEVRKRVLGDHPDSRVRPSQLTDI
jgi:hypothetical protein